MQGNSVFKPPDPKFTNREKHASITPPTVELFSFTVVLLIVSLLGFPLGFTSGFVRHHCGPSASVYSPGDCEIGWAYALVLVSTSLSLYCPVLVKFTAEIRYGALPKYL